MEAEELFPVLNTAALDQFVGKGKEGKVGTLLFSVEMGYQRRPTRSNEEGTFHHCRKGFQRNGLQELRKRGGW